MARWYRRFRFIYTSGDERGSAWLRTHPGTEERVRALLEMEDKVRLHPVMERYGGGYVRGVGERAFWG